MNILLGILLGSFFGFALAYVGATSYKNILKMLRLEDLALAKIILFAIGFSSVLVFISSMLGIFDLSHFHIKSMNLGVITGGIIFGFAFGSIGTCPGTCIGALTGSNIKRAVFSIFGGLLGAFTFSISYEYFYNIGLFNALNIGKLTLFNISTEYPSIFSIGTAGLLISGLLFMFISYILPEEILKS